MKTQDFTLTDFIGHWRVRGSVVRFDWILRNDSSFAGKCSLFGIPIMRLTGTWSIDGDKLVSIYPRQFLLRAEVEDTDTLLEVAQDYFILMTSRGTRRRWERVNESRMA